VIVSTVRAEPRKDHGPGHGVYPRRTANERAALREWGGVEGLLTPETGPRIPGRRFTLAQILRRGGGETVGAGRNED
jgi:hypothetical protein